MLREYAIAAGAFRRVALQRIEFEEIRDTSRDGQFFLPAGRTEGDQGRRWKNSKERSGRPAQAPGEFIRTLDVPLLTQRKGTTTAQVALPSIGGNVTRQAVKAWVERQLGLHPQDSWVINP